MNAINPKIFATHGMTSYTYYYTCSRSLLPSSPLSDGTPASQGTRGIQYYKRSLHSIKYVIVKQGEGEGVRQNQHRGSGQPKGSGSWLSKSVSEGEGEGDARPSRSSLPSCSWCSSYAWLLCMGGSQWIMPHVENRLITLLPVCNMGICTPG